MMLSEKEYAFMEQVWEAYLDIKKDDQYDQVQKNEKYASLMTTMEHQFNIPLIAGSEFDKLDCSVKELYLDISNARDFEIYSPEVER